jgi:hypothetical protein
MQLGGGALSGNTHRDRDPPLGVIQIGCSLAYDEPPPERCGCVAGVCRAR